MAEFSDLRLKAGITESEASELLGISTAAVAKYETGEQRPSARELQSLRGLALIAQSHITQPEREAAELRPLFLQQGVQTKTAAIAIVRDDIRAILGELLSRGHMSAQEMARALQTSLVSVTRWIRGDGTPNTEMDKKIRSLHQAVVLGRYIGSRSEDDAPPFQSRGARKKNAALPLFKEQRSVTLSNENQAPLLRRLMKNAFWRDGQAIVRELIHDHRVGCPTIDQPAVSGVSAGKNTYTYDAHTYHTKVPPQGIVEILRQYLPHGGLVLDPFAGSGMTGVASRAGGYDVILNELSPAASFISDRFTTSIEPGLFAAGVNAVCNALRALRDELYKTKCRECGSSTELQYSVWSYRVLCSECSHEFTLWDQCRSYGRTVREHKILSEFQCPECNATVRKSHLKRTQAVPVIVGYKCCKGKQVEHPLSEDDKARIAAIERKPRLIDGFYPTTQIPNGVNLGQPRRHGLVSIDRFYTARNLSALSHIWHAIHRIEDRELAAFLGFTFTSLYQRVTRLSEFRFWGGSGNTANFNVPHIFNEANVFVTFERKARTIQDHLETTARQYRSRCVVRTGSATRLDFLPDNSIDLIFTDPPFGANINYSEMNILWEAWLDAFTDSRDEAIVNRHQGKDVNKYGDLMRASLVECYRVLRPGHWLLLVFMNSSEKVWEQLKRAIREAGFSLERIDIFDKQHGTFKQFVSDNTAGSDLILHCRKAEPSADHNVKGELDCIAEISHFLRSRKGQIPRLPYLHVNRSEEIDYRLLYSEWLASGLLNGSRLLDFASFRLIAEKSLGANKQ